LRLFSKALLLLLKANLNIRQPTSSKICSN
jgi:hypothetical protein